MMPLTGHRVLATAALGMAAALGTTYAPGAAAPSAVGTYLADILDAREGFLYRWPDRSENPIRVWIQAPHGRRAAPATFITRVQDGIRAWDRVALPVRFTFVEDSAAAEVHVVWVDAFEDRMTGQTAWRHDAAGWLLGGTIELAHHQPDGSLVGADAVQAIAEHEVGHLLGLGHTDDATSIMSPAIRVTDMNEADRATARLVYALAPGWQVRY